MPGQESRITIACARRRALLGAAGGAALAPLLGLTGCGGGGATSGAPAIQRFSAAGTAALFVGEPARLQLEFTGGQGRIEPDIGPVSSGIEVPTPPLDRERRYTLIVEAPGQLTARHALDLQPQFRGRYVALTQPFALQYHAAVTAGDGSVIVIGGSRGGATLSAAIDRYEPAARRFSRIGEMRTGRDSHSATRLPDGQILVLGGNTSLADGPAAELIDERSGAVGSVGPLARTRSRHAAVALADGRVLVVGGLNRDSVELWDPHSRGFRLVAARMRHVREFPTATLLADGRVLIAGGYHIAAENLFAEIFDPASERFTPVNSPLGDRRQMHQAHRLSDGRVLIAGGEIQTEDSLTALASVLLFDPADNSLSAPPGLDQPRSLLRSALLPDDRLLMFGGQTASEPAMASASVYRAGEPARALPPMPTGRAWHTVSRLGDGRVLILGGDDAGGAPMTSAYLYE